MPPSSSKAEQSQALLIAGRGLRLHSLHFHEDRLFYTFLLLSCAAHLVFLAVEDLTWLRESTPLVEEWVIDADLLTDLDAGAPLDTALPKAEKDEEAAVPDNLLPQLPKKFALNDATAPDEGVGETVKDPVKDLMKAEKETVEDKKVNMKSDPDEANRLLKDEALKRLAMERLRKEKAKKITAPSDNPLARLREELAKRKNLNSGVTGVSAAQRQLYRSVIQKAVRRNYALPEAYNLKNANLRVVIQIVLSERGNLMKLDLSKSSGDTVFDELALKAVKASTPLPKPPKDLAGEAINLQFTPKSF